MDGKLLFFVKQIQCYEEKVNFLTKKVNFWTNKFNNMTNNDNFLAVRSGPGSNHQIIDQIHTGDQIKLCKKTGAWYFIRYDNDTSKGWVFGRYIKTW